MIRSLLRESKTDKCLANTAAGTTDTLNGDIIDMQGFSSIMFICTLGDVANTAVGTLKAYVGNTSNLADGAYRSTMATFTATATSADNKIIILDMVKINSRYVRPDFVRAIANIAVENITAIRYNPINAPVAQGVDYLIGAIIVN